MPTTTIGSIFSDARARGRPARIHWKQSIATRGPVTKVSTLADAFDVPQRESFEQPDASVLPRASRGSLVEWKTYQAPAAYSLPSPSLTSSTSSSSDASPPTTPPHTVHSFPSIVTPTTSPPAVSRAPSTRLYDPSSDRCPPGVRAYYSEYQHQYSKSVPDFLTNPRDALRSPYAPCDNPDNSLVTLEAGLACLARRMHFRAMDGTVSVPPLSSSTSNTSTTSSTTTSTTTTSASTTATSTISTTTTPTVRHFDCAEPAPLKRTSARTPRTSRTSITIERVPSARRRSSTAWRPHAFAIGTGTYSSKRPEDEDTQVRRPRPRPLPSPPVDPFARAGASFYPHWNEEARRGDVHDFSLYVPPPPSPQPPASSPRKLPIYERWARRVRRTSASTSTSMSAGTSTPRARKSSMISNATGESEEEEEKAQRLQCLGTPAAPEAKKRKGAGQDLARARADAQTHSEVTATAAALTPADAAVRPRAVSTGALFGLRGKVRERAFAQGAAATPPARVRSERGYSAVAVAAAAARASGGSLATVYELHPLQVQEYATASPATTTPAQWPPALYLESESENIEPHEVKQSPSGAASADSDPNPNHDPHHSEPSSSSYPYRPLSQLRPLLLVQKRASEEQGDQRRSKQIDELIVLLSRKSSLQLDTQATGERTGRFRSRNSEPGLRYYQSRRADVSGRTLWASP